ncbi:MULTISPECIES: HNH endonuclease [Xanthomonas]|uniref:HNH endonuclease n=1 Tax=Xanthomonas TaxID=338 RepID=UPI0012900D84|nr:MULTISPECIES: HNH endonuclease signature motif containing protein [Xanthomonas]
MPTYTSADGISVELADWPGGSYKATVINNAYANHQFWLTHFMGQATVVFKCFWCKKFIPSSAVEGDHIVAQQNGTSGNATRVRLYQEAQNSTNPDGSPWNLVLSCSECNGGSRNKSKMMLRSDYSKDRDKQGPSGGGGSIGVK